MADRRPLLSPHVEDTDDQDDQSPGGDLELQDLEGGRPAPPPTPTRQQGDRQDVQREHVAATETGSRSGTPVGHALDLLSFGGCQGTHLPLRAAPPTGLSMGDGPTKAD